MVLRESAKTLAGLATIATLACIDAPAGAQCALYDVDVVPGPDCPVTFSQSSATGISETGELCGGYSTCSSSGAGVWLGRGLWIPLPLPAGVPWIAPQDINSSRQIAAFMPEPSNPEVIRRAAFYDFNTSMLVDIGHLPGDTESESYGINENGVGCGYSVDSSGAGTQRGFLWQDGQLFALDLPMGPYAVAYDIGDNGAVCGWMGLGPHIDAHAFVWLNGRTTDLGVVLDGAIGADARGISSNGQIVCGICRFSNGPPRMAFVHLNGVGQSLGMLPIPGHDRSLAYAVNNDAIVVGQSLKPSLSGVGFVWRNGVMKALNDLIPPGQSLNIDWPRSINNAGQIAGSARMTDGSNDQVAVRLTPVQPPPGDCDCNGNVGIQDLLNTIGQWGPAIPTTTADFDNNGVVNIHDLFAVIINWD